MFAGLTVAVMLIPQGMAYAMLAGLPPIYGLYASLVPLLLYPLLGTSRQLSVGPVATVSVLVLSGLSAFAEAGTAEFIHLAILVSILSGIMQLVLSAFRLGFMAKFLSEPVLLGFTMAAAFIIAVGQLPNILGIVIPRSSSTIEMMENIFWSLNKVNILTLLIGSTALGFLVLMKKVSRTFPSALLVVIAGISLVYFLNLEQEGISIIGAVPTGLPQFEIPRFNLDQLEQIFPLALAIGLLSFIESLAIAKSVAAKHNNYPINADRELLALGVSKIVGGFFQAYPTNGSFSRSAVNDLAGARTGISSIVTAFLVGIALLFLTDVIYYLPKAILAAIVLAAVVGLFNVAKAKFYYKISKHDFWIMITTFLSTLLLGIQNGILSGVILSVGYVLYRSSKPHYAVLGYLETDEGTPVFRDVSRFDKARERQDLLMIRFNCPLYFGSSEYFKEIIWEELNKRPNSPTYLLLDFSSVHTIDATGLEVLSQVNSELSQSDIQLILTNVQGNVRDKLGVSGLMNKIGAENQFLINKDAYTFTANPHNRSVIKMKYANQTREN